MAGIRSVATVPPDGRAAPALPRTPGALRRVGCHPTMFGPPLPRPSRSLQLSASSPPRSSREARALTLPSPLAGSLSPRREEPRPAPPLPRPQTTPQGCRPDKEGRARAPPDERLPPGVDRRSPPGTGNLRPLVRPPGAACGTLRSPALGACPRPGSLKAAERARSQPRASRKGPPAAERNSAPRAPRSQEPRGHGR